MKHLDALHSCLNYIVDYVVDNNKVAGLNNAFVRNYIDTNLEITPRQTALYVMDILPCSDIFYQSFKQSVNDCLVDANMEQIL